MRSVAASVVSLIGFSTLFSAAPSLAAGITNGGFEDPVNGFNGWEVKGNTKIETSAFGSGPTEGSQQALTLTAKPAVAASEIESFLGLATGSLNGIANKNVQNGSAIKQTFSATAGQKLTFDWNFLTDEGRTGQAGVDYTDFGFVSLGIVSELADTKFSTFSLSDADFRAETGFNTFEYIIQTSGEYILGVGVANVNDTKVHSALLVDNVKLASVPEPGSMVTTAEKTNIGYITQVIGPVVDVKFSGGKMPPIYNALTIKGTNEAGQEVSVTCEVQQLLGDNQVRTVAMNE